MKPGTLGADPDPPPTTAVIVAAGAGERLGAGTPKAFVELGGEPMLAHSVRAFLACEAVHDVVCVVPAEHVERTHRLLARAHLAVTAVTAGGASRQESVSLGLVSCPSSARIVAVHDASRPLVSPALIGRVVAALTTPWDAVAPALPVVDTLKLVDGAQRRVLRTIDRRGVWAVQTPQVLSRITLERVHARVATAADAATDDLSLVERAGGRVRLIEGDRRNVKITYPNDLALAEAILSAQRRDARAPSAAPTVPDQPPAGRFRPDPSVSGPPTGVSDPGPFPR
ncbi:MAG: 2-C-methyl-D-erythritol 4-phosphate cytidylyltransferase [Actinomycetota bacterium]|nr:2-C-methyl-D-erythritol 4-phosphate cytidylyltransferase [Actinomycetota bacterium]